MILTAATVITADAVHSPGHVLVEEGLVVGVGGGRGGVDSLDLGDAVLTAGFVDIHCHGGGGSSFTTGDPAEARRVLAAHRALGTTSMMASLVTDTTEALQSQVRGLAPLVTGGELLGVHLEGPWLSEHHCGAHDPTLLRDPKPAAMDAVIDASADTVRMVTLAPEREHGMAAVAHLAARGILPALGHSDAPYDVAREAIDAGASVATHLFNAMRPIHHREPGPVLALVEDPRVTIEVIADGVHLHPAIVQDVFHAVPERAVLVTDAMSAAGAGDGHYLLGPLGVTVQDGVARLDEGGAIAGSTLTLDAAVRFCVKVAEVELAAAVRAATIHPARTLGRDDIGDIAPGRSADLVVLSPELEVRRVMHRGTWLD
ncbi:MAG: N-acetylglucosamine-6-phosphate deacetylase [Micrococcales bacterium]|nr:N-acetylglucosamine-6-phosphate deacetylase [Micrococcales bacterium]